MWELDYKESWVLKNWCFWTLESPLDCKEIQPVHPKGDQSWVFIGRTDVEAETPNTSATWCKELTHLKRPWCWERLGAGGEGDETGWDGWMALPTRWTWVWVNSGSWWWTGRPGILRFMGSQRVGHDWVTELNWKGFPDSSVGKRIHLQCRRPWFDSWVRQIPWRRERLPTPVFWPGEFHGLDCIVQGVAKSQTWLSDFHFPKLFITPAVFFHSFVSYPLFLL